MGTPEPAKKILQALLAARQAIILVVTQPDRGRGRGQKLAGSPVSELAAQIKLPIQKPESVKDPAFIGGLKALSPDLIVVVAYGKILPKAILEIPKHGCINVHASLLPKYRGAAPVQWAILNGEKETGVTIMQLDAGLDTGPIFSQAKISVDADDTTMTLMDKLFAAGAPLLLSVIKAIENGRFATVPQDNACASFAPALRKEEGSLDFKKTARATRDRIRACEAWPGAFTYYKGKPLKILRADKNFYEFKKPFAPGAVVDIINGRGFVVAAADQGILLEEVQPDSGKKMSAYDFVLGRKVKVGDIFPN